MPTYTNAFFKQRINAGIKGKIGMLTNANDTLNQVVRTVLSDIDLRSTKRKSFISPNLFSDIYSYAAPTDMKGASIIDIRPQINRNRFSEVSLTTVEEFSRLQNTFRCAVDDRDILKKVLISIPVNDISMTISTLDSITAGGGTWVVTGDATNLRASSDNVVKGSSALVYDIGSGGTTTAGIKNTGLDVFDITDYLSNQIFHYEYITSTTNLTSYTLRVGSSTSDYYKKTVTTTHDTTAFTQGYNLLRFDLTNATVVGSPDSTSCNYVEIFMNKTAGKINEYGYIADDISAKKGEVYEIMYYSEYGWVNTSNAYLLDSTSTTDYLIADSDEFELFVQKGIEMAAQEVEDDSTEKKAFERYENMKDVYLGNNPSESKILISQYYQF